MNLFPYLDERLREPFLKQLHRDFFAGTKLEGEWNPQRPMWCLADNYQPGLFEDLLALQRGPTITLTLAHTHKERIAHLIGSAHETRISVDVIEQTVGKYSYNNAEITREDIEKAWRNYSSTTFAILDLAGPGPELIVMDDSNPILPVGASPVSAAVPATGITPLPDLLSLDFPSESKRLEFRGLRFSTILSMRYFLATRFAEHIPRLYQLLNETKATSPGELRSKLGLSVDDYRFSYIEQLRRYPELELSQDEVGLLTKPLTTSALSLIGLETGGSRPKFKNAVDVTRYDIWVRAYGYDARIEERCYCCGNTPISVNNFHVGHIMSIKRNGANTVNNLRPICNQCNSTMGVTHMGAFIKARSLNGRGRWDEGVMGKIPDEDQKEANAAAEKQINALK